MKKKHVVTALTLFLFGLVLLITLYIYASDSALLNPKGWVALQQRNLLFVATLLMLIVVIPVIVMTFVFAWKYRANNPKAKYTPDWDYSLVAESIWWGFPLVIIIALSVITWKSTHALDPFKPIETGVRPMTIQVVALQWKWLFIYPEENIATVNFIQFPENTPINFEITADAPMNSFWIPQLGGQIYAMPGMKTKLHLIANEVGSFRGSSANLSGKGFAGMTFVAKSSSRADFDRWVQSAKQSSNALTLDVYNQLAEPSENNPVVLYSLKDESLFEGIVMKPMTPIRN